MVVNDNAGLLDRRGVLESIASMLAPTGDAYRLTAMATCVSRVRLVLFTQENRVDCRSEHARDGR